MKYRAVLNLLTRVFGIALLNFPLSVLAIGQIATPIVIDDAVSGQTYESQLTLISNSSKDQMYRLTATGDIADWAKFYSINNSNDPITEIEIPANSNINATIRFEIPEMMPIGTYEGSAVLAMLADGSGEQKSGVVVSQQISRNVTIKITGQQEASSFVVIRAQKSQIPQGEPMTFTVLCNNTGNVLIKPIIEVEVFKNNETIDDIIYPYDKEKRGIIPNQTETLDAVWQSGNREQGNYVASIKVYLDDELSQETRFPFEITNKINNLAAADMSSAVFNNLYVFIGIGLVLLTGIILLIAKIKRKN